MKFSVKILKLDYHVRIIPLSVKKEKGILEEMASSGSGKEVSKGSLRHLVLSKSKDTLKDSHVKDHRSQMKGADIDKRWNDFTKKKKKKPEKNNDSKCYNMSYKPPKLIRWISTSS